MSERKKQLQAYKERKVEAGIYAVRCAASGEAWVGSAPDLSNRQNRIWFSLRHGSHRELSLQAAWRAHGEGAFAYEPLEAIDDEGLDAFGRAARLKARREHWIAALNAKGLS